MGGHHDILPVALLLRAPEAELRLDLSVAVSTGHSGSQITVLGRPRDQVITEANHNNHMLVVHNEWLSIVEIHCIPL